MNVTILGAGYVGLTTAALLANCDGYVVTLVDTDQAKLAIINTGKSHFYEVGLDELISNAISSQSLRTTADYAQAIPGSDVVFSCVGTPDKPGGGTNIVYVQAAAQATMQYATHDIIYAQKSTVPVGTGEQLEKIFSASVKHIAYVSNPEFLREGTAVYDTLIFDRVVVGSNDKTAASSVINIYQDLEAQTAAIAKTASITRPAPIVSGTYIKTSLNSAELIKVSSNAFLALKISFANSIALLADQAGADVTEVMDAVGADKRIGRAFLNAGRGYGGGCFPKDVRGLISYAATKNIDMEIMRAATSVNQQMPAYVVTKLMAALPVSVLKPRIALLGLAFKANTSDTRKSPAIEIANLLVQRGATVIAYDPRAQNEETDQLDKHVTIATSLAECIKDADSVCVATDWQDFLDMDLNAVITAMKGSIFVDTMNAFDKTKVKQAGLTHISVGR
jgi:UDPglucose 6-dehydrogenase